MTVVVKASVLARKTRISRENVFNILHKCLIMSRMVSQSILRLLSIKKKCVDDKFLKGICLSYLNTKSF